MNELSFLSDLTALGLLVLLFWAQSRQRHETLALIIAFLERKRVRVHLSDDGD